MGSRFAFLLGVTSIAVLSFTLHGCSSDSGFNGGNGHNSSVAWTNGGSSFDGAFGWDSGGVSQTALVSGTSCDDMENSVDIFNGFSQDPCSLESNDDGSPFEGTIAGTVCNTNEDTQTDHTITCNHGAISDVTQDVEAIVVLPFLTLFTTTASTNGNVGGRAGADAFCQNNKPAGITNHNIRAFTSVDDTDEVRDMPTNYGVETDLPIQTPNGTQLAIDWANLLDGSIDNSLAAGGITDHYYWTQTFSVGELANGGALYTCAGSTDGTGSAQGAAGDNTYQNYNWIQSFPAFCNDQYPILCLGFN